MKSIPEELADSHNVDQIMTHWYRIGDVTNLWEYATTVGRYRGQTIWANPQVLHRFARRVLEVHVNTHNQVCKGRPDSVLILGSDRRAMQAELDEEVGRLWRELVVYSSIAARAETLIEFCDRLKKYHELVASSGEYVAFVLAEANTANKPAETQEE